MQIHLHIGLDKAGSSAIQSNVMRNRDWFHHQAMFIPNVGLTSTGYWSLFSDLSSQSFDDLERELELAAGIGFENAFMSWEGINTYSDEQISQLCRIFEDHEVKIYVYLREQSEVIQSGYFQQVKTSAQRRILGDFQVGSTLLYPQERNYAAMLERFAKAFGKDAIHVRIFDREQLKNRNVVVDMLDLIGLEPDSDFDLAADEDNPSLDLASVRILNLLDHYASDENWEKPALESQNAFSRLKNKLLGFRKSYEEPDFSDKAKQILGLYFGHSTTGRKDIVDILLNTIDSEGKVGKYFLSESCTEFIQNHYRESNLEVAKAYFGEVDTKEPLFSYAKSRTVDVDDRQVKATMLSRMNVILEASEFPTWDGKSLEGTSIFRNLNYMELAKPLIPSTPDSKGATQLLRFRVQWKHWRGFHTKLVLVVKGVAPENYLNSSVIINGIDLGSRDLRDSKMDILRESIPALGLITIEVKHNFLESNENQESVSKNSLGDFNFSSLRYGRRK